MEPETKAERRERLRRQEASRRVTVTPRRDPFWGRWVPKVSAAMRLPRRRGKRA